MADYVRILVDEGAAKAPHPDDRGWRFRVLREDGGGRVHLYEEQVWPEKVSDQNAHHIRAQHAIGMTEDEARWVVQQIREAFGWSGTEIEDERRATARIAFAKGAACMGNRDVGDIEGYGMRGWAVFEEWWARYESGYPDARAKEGK